MTRIETTQYTVVSNVENGVTGFILARYVFENQDSMVKSYWSGMGWTAQRAYSTVFENREIAKKRLAEMFPA